jgi:hypothetical protein
MQTAITNIKNNLYMRHPLFVSVTSIYLFKRGFSGLEVASGPLVPKFAGSHLAEAVGFLGRKNPQHAFGGEEKPSVPCSFTACKRSLNVT